MVKIIANSEYTYLERCAYTISKEEYESYEKFYRLYEYTDAICVLEDDPLYPGLLNYVKTGLLTEEELRKALEYDMNSEQ